MGWFRSNLELVGVRESFFNQCKLWPSAKGCLTGAGAWFPLLAVSQTFAC